MQKANLAICVLSAFLFCFSCSKTNGPANANSVQPNNKLDTLVAMNASINNHKFATDSAFGYNIKPLVTDSSFVMNLLITGSQTKADSISSISLSISNFTGPNTYNINPPYVTASWYLNNQRHYAGFGQIVILSDSNYALIGTFSFIADSVLVNNGSFNVLMPY